MDKKYVFILEKKEIMQYKYYFIASKTIYGQWTFKKSTH